MNVGLVLLQSGFEFPTGELFGELVANLLNLKVNFGEAWIWLQLVVIPLPLVTSFPWDPPSGALLEFLHDLHSFYDERQMLGEGQSLS